MCDVIVCHYFDGTEQNYDFGCRYGQDRRNCYQCFCSCKGQESKGSITDINGKYQIVDVASNATLIFSYIGMREQEIAVNGRSTINVKMEEDSQLIDEVVVVGYGSAKKRDLTGSIVTVKADEIASKPSTNPLASIQGKVAGVQVVNTGRAGQDPEIRVRGTNSINGFKPFMW